MSAIGFLTPSLREWKLVLTTGMAHIRTTLVSFTTSFGWVSEKLSDVWVRLFLKMLKIVTAKDRTHTDRVPVYHLTTLQAELFLSNSNKVL